MSNWSRNYEQHRLGIIELIEQRATPFERTGEEARHERRGLPFLPWCRTYLPHYFEAPFADFHKRMMQAVGEPGMPTFVCAFRGAGKSVLLTLARPLHRVLTGQAPYLIFGSQVQKLAAQNMDCVKLELEHNARLHGDYGEPEISGPSDRWTVSVPHRRGACRLEAFGIGMSPRGRRHGEHRPTEFIGDDLEDAELARNPEREQNLWDWLMDEVLPALEPDRAVFTVLGTMFGPQCMMARARQLAGRRDGAGRPLGRVFLQKATEEGHTVWPERFSDETLDRVRATIGLRNWLRNYALSPDDPSRPFRPDWLGTYRPEEVDVQELDVVVFLDPAVSSSGCPRALVAVGADRRRGTRYVLDAWIETGSPMEMIGKLFEFDGRFAPRVIGIESNGGYALIRPLLREVEARRGRRLPARYVNHSRPKALRIESLCAPFEQGRWRFPAYPSAGVKTLQEQFLSYPDGYVDGPDAAAGCEELLPQPGVGRDRRRYRSVERRTDYSSL